MKDYGKQGKKEVNVTARKSVKTPIKVINVMKDGRELDSLEGIEAPEVIYDILLRDYKARGITLVAINEQN